MGIDRSYLACVGVRLPWNKIERKTYSMEPSCHCNDRGAGKFCQECGREIKVNKTYDTSLYPYVIDNDGEYRIGNWIVHRDNYGWSETQWAFIGETFSVEEGESDGFGDMEILPYIKAQLRDLLEPLGLWTDGYFGFWIWVKLS